MGQDEHKQIEKWARKIKASDEAAFSEFFHMIYPRMIRFSWRYTKSKTSSEDIVQESFIKLWEVRSTINPRHSLLAYVFQMVRNRSLNYLRDHHPHQPSLTNIPEAKMEADVSMPGTISDNNYDGKRMMTWINDLPDRQQEAIRLSRFEGLNHNEIAYVMDISPRTVNNHIVKALNTLKNNWQAYKAQQP